MTPTPYTYKLESTAPAYPDFIADVLEACDVRKVSVTTDVAVQRAMMRDALCALKVALATNSDEPLNDFAERYFNLGQS